MIGCQPDKHDNFRTKTTQSRFQIGADKRIVDLFVQHRLAFMRGDIRFEIPAWLAGAQRRIGSR